MSERGIAKILMTKTHREKQTSAIYSFFLLASSPGVRTKVAGSLMGIHLYKNYTIN